MKVIYCGFSKINSTNHFRQSTWRKGSCLHASKHVGEVREEIFDQESTIYGNCIPQTSINKALYQITIKLSEDRTIVSAKCSCKAGIAGNCKHCAALVIHVNETRETSCTSEKAVWGIPSVKEGYSKGKKLCDMFPTQNRPPPVPKVDMYNVLEKFPGVNCVMEAVLKAEKECHVETEIRVLLHDIVTEVCTSELVNLLTSILMKKTETAPYHAYRTDNSNGRIKLSRICYGININEREFLRDIISVTLTKILTTATKTVKQSECEEWYDVRKFRITSSISHRIITRKKNFEILCQKLLNSSSFKGNTATAYGKKMEKAARSSFEFKTKQRVVLCGVVISEDFPWLCCSPDGIILGLEPKLLEIKCPYSRKGLKIIDNEKHVSYVPYLSFDGCTWNLKKRHQYYSQVQVSLFVLKLKSCILYVYSSADHVQVEIKRDDSFLAEYIPKLERFYFDHLLKNFVNK